MVTVDPMTGNKLPFVKSENLKFSQFGEGDQILKIRGDDVTSGGEYLIHTNGKNEFLATIIKGQGSKSGIAIPLGADEMGNKRKMRSFFIPDVTPFRGRSLKEKRFEMKFKS